MEELKKDIEELRVLIQYKLGEINKKYHYDIDYDITINRVKIETFDGTTFKSCQKVEMNAKVNI